MFSHTFGRSVLGVVLAATLLVPAAQADGWARDSRAGLDPGIAAAIHDRASLTPEPVALDPAIRAALLERASSITRPDDRAGARGPGFVVTGPPLEAVASSDAFQWDDATLGAAAALGAMLLAAALAYGMRRRGRLILH